MKTYFLSEINEKGNHAGTKARNDAEQIFELNKFKVLNNKKLYAKNENREFKFYFNSLLATIRSFIEIIRKENCLIFVQYPVIKGKLLNTALKIASNKNKICYLIHDINCLRCNLKEREKFKKQEISMFNKAEYLIIHNNKMENKLRELGLKTKTINLELFDYLLSENSEKEKKYEKTICYAGNLEKGGFLEKLCEREDFNFSINLYGPNFNESMAKNHYIKYKGNYSPNEIVNKLDSSFGLIWDGSSLERCEGIKGEYTKYNNPHKLSLYIAAGIPVIVWSEAAIADFVKRYKIGICVESLNDIEKEIDKISENDYLNMVNNISLISKKVTSGYYLNKAIQKTRVKLYNVN